MDRSQFVWRLASEGELGVRVALGRCCALHLNGSIVAKCSGRVVSLRAFWGCLGIGNVVVDIRGTGKPATYTAEWKNSHLGLGVGVAAGFITDCQRGKRRNRRLGRGEIGDFYYSNFWQLLKL